jgi:hypothetical protein
MVFITITISAVLGWFIGNAIGDALTSWFLSAVTEPNSAPVILICNILRLASIASVFFLCLNVIRASGLK